MLNSPGANAPFPVVADRPRGTRATAVATLAAACVLPATVLAQSYTEVEPVIVSATRSERSDVSIPAAIQVIGRQEIEASGARSVPELLRGRGGVQVFDLTSDENRGVIGMRGMSENAHSNTLVMVDGRRLNNSDIAPPDLAAISLKDIERIEIIQGSAGVLFGDQAVAGVVNIITRKTRGFVAEGTLRTGSYNRRGAEVAVTDRFDNGLSYRVSGEKRETDNYRDNATATYNNVFARLEYEHATGSLFAEVQHINDNRRAPGSLTRAEVAADRRQVTAGKSGDYVNTDTTSERAGLRQAFGDNVSLEMELANRETDAFFLLGFGTTPASGPPATQERRTTEFTPRLVGAWDTDNGELLLTAGYDLAVTDYELQSTLGSQLNEQMTYGYYAQTVLPVLPRWSLTLGARYAAVDNTLQDTFLFPSGVDIGDNRFLTETGLSFRPDDAWRLFVRRDENVRFAKVDEFLDFGAGRILDTQTGVSWEMGTEWQRGAYSARALAYRLDLDNEIVPVQSTAAFGFPANTNLDKTRRDGVIVGLGWQAMDTLYLSADWSYVDAKIRRGTSAGARVPFVARHSVRLGAEYRPLRGVTVSGEFLALSNRVLATDFDRKLPLLAGQGVFNLALSYELDDWTFGARVNNVFDKQYSEFASRSDKFLAPPVEAFYPAPERNFWLTASYRFSM